jgi:AmmeMemoRadiSam system protein B
VEGDGVRVRPAAVAGRFYPDDPNALAALVDALLADVPPPRRRVRPVAVVAPHAGLRFSGPVAAAAYADLTSWRSNVSRVMVLSPAHFTPLHGMAIPSVGAFATPFGPVPVDADARTIAAGLSAVVVDDEPHASEHAIETQLPFLIRALGPAVPVLPVVVGDTPPSTVATLLSTVLAAAGTIVVVSTDLSHYLNRAQARERDTHTAAASSPATATRSSPATPAVSTPCAGCCATPWTATSSSISSSWPRRPTPEAIPGASSDTEPSCFTRQPARPRSDPAPPARRAGEIRPPARSRLLQVEVVRPPTGGDEWDMHARATASRRAISPVIRSASAAQRSSRSSSGTPR